MVDLLHCPFCGGKAERLDFETVGSALGGDPNAGGSCISCTRCSASGPVHFDRKENLYSSWNERAALSSLPAPDAPAEPSAESKEAERRIRNLFERATSPGAINISSVLECVYAARAKPAPDAPPAQVPCIGVVIQFREPRP